MKRSIGDKKTPLYPAPAVVVAAYDAQDRPCGLTAAWAGVCASTPASLAVAVRRQRYTYSAIAARKAFTVNVPNEALMAVADYFGIFSGRDRDKFAEAGVTARRGTFVDAPVIEEFPISFECKVIAELDLGSHVQFVGQIMDCTVVEEALDDRGQIDPEVIRPLVFLPGTGLYYGLGQLVGRAYSAGKALAVKDNGGL